MAKPNKTLRALLIFVLVAECLCWFSMQAFAASGEPAIPGTRPNVITTLTLPEVPAKPAPKKNNLKPSAQSIQLPSPVNAESRKNPKPSASPPPLTNPIAVKQGDPPKSQTPGQPPINFSTGRNKADVLSAPRADSEFQKALKLQEEKQYKEAVQAYKLVLNHDRKNVLAWNNLGLIEQHFKRYELAMRCYQRAIELDSRDAQGYNNLGALKVELGQYLEAEKLYLTAIENDPDYPFTYNNLAILYQRQGLMFEAVKSFKTAISKAELPELYYNLGLLYFEMKKYDDMLETFDQALRLKSVYPEVYYSIALAYLYNLTELPDKQRQAAFDKVFQKLSNSSPALADDFRKKYLTATSRMLVN